MKLMPRKSKSRNISTLFIIGWSRTPALTTRPKSKSISRQHTIRTPPEISLPPDHLRECGIVAGTKISGPSSLVGGKKESFVFADRAGQRAAEVILVVPPLPVTEGISRGAVRFEQAVPVEFVGGAVNSVAAGFHRKVKNSAARPRIIGADVARDQAEFTDRLSAGRQLDGRASDVIALDRDTVHLNFETERLAAVDGARERASRCARQGVKHK